jgi:sphingomyelin phosphodiesterase acid-like 3
LKRIPALFRLAALLCLLPFAKSSAAQFLWLSDIHFDPFADPSLVDQLSAAEPAQWPPILAGGSAKFSAFGRDASWPLFASALDASKKAQPKAAFTIVTGDLLAHHFRDQFNAAASNHSDDAFRSFVRKTMEFTALQLKQLSPVAPVILSLGNNDDICGDYLIQPNGPFLRDTGKLVGDLAHIADLESFSNGWSANGSYSLPHPTLPNYRIIVLNSVFFSPRYRDSCGGGAGDPGNGVLTWLANQLAAAKSQHQKVWLVYHIPPGVDAFATTHPKQPVPEGNVTLLWKDSYAKKFTGLMEQYRGVVGPIFAGHIHVDDFRLLSDSSKESAFIMMDPAVSPNTGQSPAFRVVTYDSRGRLTDQATYFLSNLTEAAKGSVPTWQLEYTFRSEWRMNELNAANYTKLYRNMDRSSQAASRWMLLYPVSRVAQGSITPANSRQFYCAIGNLSIADYQTCVAKK